MSKVQLWALYMPGFMYKIKHISGENRIMADVMTRWFSSYPGMQGEVQRVTESLATIDILPSAEEAELEWPAEEIIMQSKMQSRRICPENIH